MNFEKLKDSDIQEILENYTIGQLKSKKLIYNAWNLVYQIKTEKGIYTLKLLRFTKMKQVKNENKILHAMDNKLPLSHPIKTKDDNICAKWKGKIIIVKKYIDGRVIKNNEKLKNSALYQLGKYHGIIHSTKKLNFLPKGYPYKYAKKFFSSVNKESREYKQAQETLNYLEEKGFDKANFPRGFIHGDLHSENIIIKRGKIVCLLDFEESHIGPFIFDLGLSILEECISDGKIIKRKLKALIAGYESYRKLTDVEKKYLAVSPLIIGVYGLSYRVKVKKQGIKESKSLTYFIKKYVDYFNKVRDIE